MTFGPWPCGGGTATNALVLYMDAAVPAAGRTRLGDLYRMLDTALRQP